LIQKITRENLSTLYGFTSRSLQILINFFFGLLIIHSISIEAFGKYAFVLALSRFIPSILRFNNIHLFNREFRFKEQSVYRAYLTKYFTYLYLTYSFLFIFLILLKFLISIDELNGLLVIYILLIIFGEHLLADLIIINFNLKRTTIAYNLNLFSNIFKVLPFISIALFFHIKANFEILAFSLALAHLFLITTISIILLRFKNYDYSAINTHTIFPTNNKSLFANNILIIFSAELPIFIVNSFFTPVVIGIFSFLNSISAAIMNVIQFGYVNKKIPIFNEYYFRKDLINSNKIQKKMIFDIFIYCTLAFALLIIFFDFLDILADRKISDQRFLIILFYFSSILYLVSGTFQKLFIYEHDKLILKLQLTKLSIFIIIFMLLFKIMSLKTLLISSIISLIIFSFLHLYFEKKYN